MAIPQLKFQKHNYYTSEEVEKLFTHAMATSDEIFTTSTIYNFDWTTKETFIIAETNNDEYYLFEIKGVNVNFDKFNNFLLAFTQILKKKKIFYKDYIKDLSGNNLEILQKHVNEHMMCELNNYEKLFNANKIPQTEDGKYVIHEGWL